MHINVDESRLYNDVLRQEPCRVAVIQGDVSLSRVP